MFAHSRAAPLLVLASFTGGAITHIADGRKGSSGGTGLVRLNLENLTALDKPLRLAELTLTLPLKFRPHFQRATRGGGLIPPKTVRAVMDAVRMLRPGVVTTPLSLLRPA